MNDLDEIARRREILIMRAATQRSMVEEAVEQIQKPLGIVNLGMTLVNYLRARPLLSIGITTAFFVARPKRFVSWGRKVWFVWQIYRSWKGSKKAV
jgi:hypothetical protein